MTLFGKAKNNVCPLRLSADNSMYDILLSAVESEPALSTYGSPTWNVKFKSISRSSSDIGSA